MGHGSKASAAHLYENTWEDTPPPSPGKNEGYTTLLLSRTVDIFCLRKNWKADNAWSQWIME